jgi:hypothetical protein
MKNFIMDRFLDLMGMENQRLLPQDLLTGAANLLSRNDEELRTCE